jgi:hypothetical protein
MKLSIPLLLLGALFAGVAPLGAQGEPPASRPVVVDEPAPLERWQRMTPEQRAKLQERFDELRKMTEGERAALRARARELEAERLRLEEKLGPDMRERLRHMPPAERDRILREHQLDERRRAGEVLREGLDSERSDWVDHLIGPDHPRPFHDLRRELRGKLEDRLVDQWQKSGGLDEKERARLKELPPHERMGELLSIHRDRIIAAVKKHGLPEGVLAEKWQKLLEEERPERFLKKARKLGVDRLVAPPGEPGPGHGPRFMPGLHELRELLHPTIEDRLETAEKPSAERRHLLDGRIAGRLRTKLREAAWLPALDRKVLAGLGDGALIERLHDFMRAQRDLHRSGRSGGPPKLPPDMPHRGGFPGHPPGGPRR